MGGGSTYEITPELVTVWWGGLPLWMRIHLRRHASEGINPGSALSDWRAALFRYFVVVNAPCVAGIGSSEPALSKRCGNCNHAQTEHAGLEGKCVFGAGLFKWSAECQPQ